MNAKKNALFQCKKLRESKTAIMQRESNHVCSALWRIRVDIKPKTLKDTLVLAMRLEVLQRSTGTHQETARVRSSYVDEKNKGRHFMPEKSPTVRRQDAATNRTDDVA